MLGQIVLFLEHIVSGQIEITTWRSGRGVAETLSDARQCSSVTVECIDTNLATNAIDGPTIESRHPSPSMNVPQVSKDPQVQWHRHEDSSSAA